MAATTSSRPTIPHLSRCIDCSVLRPANATDWSAQGLCPECQSRRRDVAKFKVTTSPTRNGDQNSRTSRAGVNPKPHPAADITHAEKSLITNLKDTLSEQRLLSLLNQRRAANAHPAFPALTVADMRHHLGTADCDSRGAQPGADWASKRQLLQRARASGLMGKITKQIVLDFAVVFSLTQAQLIRLTEMVDVDSEDEA